MERQPIDLRKLVIRPYDVFGWQWMLLTSGTRESHNCMTVGLGAVGNVFLKPAAVIYVRPTRYTYEFMERYETFTLCAFPEEFHPALEVCGTRSGRNTDKVREAGLTPMDSAVAEAPSYAEAELVLECRKLYFDDLKPGNVCSRDVEVSGPSSHASAHRMYVGEVLAVFGTDKYIAR